jgi:hypothetical protein
MTRTRKKKTPGVMYLPPVEKPMQPQITFLGLNINSLIQGIVGSVVIFLITTAIQQGRANHDLLIKHTDTIEAIQTEQARISQEYTPPVHAPIKQ